MIAGLRILFVGADERRLSPAQIAVVIYADGRLLDQSGETLVFKPCRTPRILFTNTRLRFLALTPTVGKALFLRTKPTSAASNRDVLLEQY